MARRRSAPPLSRWAWLVWALGGLFWIGALGLPVTSLPANTLGLRGFRTPEISPALQLAQSFRMTADGFHAVEIYPAQASSPASGTLTLALVDTSRDGVAVWSRAVKAADFVRSWPYRLEFEPIPDSKNREYRLELTANETDPGTGVALWATKGGTDEDGTLLANGRRRWADLAFRTSAPTSSIWQRLTSENRGSNNVPGPLVLTLFGVTWLALGAALQLLAAVWRRAAQGDLSPSETSLAASPSHVS